MLSCSNISLPAALKAGGARTLTCVCADRSSAKLVEGKLRGVRVIEGSSGYTDLADESQQAVVLHLPVKAEKTTRLESDLRNALCEARRILADEGRLIVIASLDHAAATLRKTQGVRMLAKYELTLSGQKSAIWVMTPKDMEESLMDS